MFELKTLTDYSDESLLAELRRVAAALQGERLTHERFNELSRVHSTTLVNRFGTWKNALDRAGISQEVAPRVRRITREKVIETIQACAAEMPGDSVTLDQVAKRIDLDPGTILRKFGK
jgi:hypothetical protein